MWKERGALVGAVVSGAIALAWAGPWVSDWWTYWEARRVAFAFARAAQMGDTAVIRSLTESGSAMSTLCLRKALPEAYWHFRSPTPRVTFQGRIGDFVEFFVHSEASPAPDAAGRLGVSLLIRYPYQRSPKVAVLGPVPTTEMPSDSTCAVHG